MKKQTIAIIAASVLFAAVGILIFLHFQKKRAGDTSGVYAFLNSFDENLASET